MTPLSSRRKQGGAMGRSGPKARVVSNEQVVEAVAACKSMAAVLRQLKLRVAGGNYQRVKWLVLKLRLDTSHWTRQGHRKGCAVPAAPAQRFCDVLVFGSHYSNGELKRRLLKAGLLAPRCASCRLDRWLDRPIPLEMDHIDGDRFNSLFCNLRLLCPNCHALTPTYRGRNIRPSVARVVKLVDTGDL